MIPKYPKRVLAVLAALAMGGCSEPVEEQITPQSSADPSAGPQAERPRLGLMTSLPLYWPLGADFGDLAQGNGEKPWQRTLLEQQFELVPLDTLSPIAGLSNEDAESDPLAGLDRLAIVQPRGLSAADNVALDEWVKAGGELLLVLDPVLTGDYDLPLGDPRRPPTVAIVPPVVSRWGLALAWSDSLPDEVTFAQLPTGPVPLLLAGEIRVVVVDGGSNGCKSLESPAIVRCDNIGEGTVTMIYDAAMFEHHELIGEEGESVRALLDYAFR